jgi:hypothetical protein
VKNDPLREKSYWFALLIVDLAKALIREKKEFVLSKQVLRSGTAIGALIREAKFGQSRSDFVNKMNIAQRPFFIFNFSFLISRPKCTELTAMLAATVKTARLRNQS